MPDAPDTYDAYQLSVTNDNASVEDMSRRMQVVQLSVLGLLFNLSEALGFFVEILRLVNDLKSGLLHTEEIFAAELPVVADLPNPKAQPAHFYETQ